ncbi:unnamed protein product [Caretta caretta]
MAKTPRNAWKTKQQLQGGKLGAAKGGSGKKEDTPSAFGGDKVDLDDRTISASGALRLAPLGSSGRKRGQAPRPAVTTTETNREGKESKLGKRREKK